MSSPLIVTVDYLRHKKSGIEICLGTEFGAGNVYEVGEIIQKTWRQMPEKYDSLRIEVRRREQGGHDIL